MKSTYDNTIRVMVIIVVSLFHPMISYSQNTICILGTPVISNSVAKLPTSASFLMKEYESEMEEGVFIRQYFNDTISVFYRMLEDKWKLTSLTISKNVGAVSVESQKEIEVGSAIAELLPYYQNIIEATGEKLIRDFDFERDVERIPAISISLKDVVYFNDARIVVHFDKGIVSRIMVIFIEEDY